MQPEILQKIHYGRQGLEKCKFPAKSCVFWNNIDQDIDKIVQGCVTCQEQQKAQCVESLKPHEISVRPWQIVATDLFQFGRSYYMLVVDYYSKYPQVGKLKDFSSQVHSCRPCNSITWRTSVQPKTCGKLTSKVLQQCKPKRKNSNPPVSKAY